MMTYKGYEIKEYETLGIGMGIKYEAWKDGILWAFSNSVDDTKKLIDMMDE